MLQLLRHFTRVYIVDLWKICPDNLIDLTFCYHQETRDEFLWSQILLQFC